METSLYLFKSNANKKKKKKQHEEEKAYMESLRACTQTFIYNPASAMVESDARRDDSESNEDEVACETTGLPLSDDDDDEADDDSKDISLPSPLYFLYDCEGTGGSIYDDHIVEIAAIVQPLCVDIRAPTEFQFLVKTSRKIKPIGNALNYDSHQKSKQCLLRKYRDQGRKG